MSKRYSWNAKVPLPKVKFKADMTTTDEVDLFSVPDTALARSTDPDASHEAASKVDSEHLSRLFLEALRAHGPMTYEEIGAVIGYPRDSVSPRGKPLRLAGLVEDSGVKRNGSHVWQIRGKE